MKKDSKKKGTKSVGAAVAAAGPALSPVAVAPFSVSPAELSRMTEAKDDTALADAGGPCGLAIALNTSLTNGVVEADPAGGVAARRAAYGGNTFKQAKSKSFFRLFFENLKDPTLVLLMGAALISTVLGAAIPEERAQSAWSEGVAIWVAVLVVSLVASGNDYQKDLQFRKLNAQKERIEIKVVRGGVEQLVLNTDLVAGDIVRLITGDKCAADGVLLAAQGLVIDEASLTGESDPIKKSVEASPWVRCGTQVSEGSGTMLVTAVGLQSEWGRTMAMVVGETGDTPLQEALTVLAAAVGKVGLGVGVLCFTVLLIRWVIENRGFPVKQFAEGPLRFFIFAVTIIVVAVPEGLPLAVTISLAYSMRKMMKDNNFVRVLAACETMGGATAICSDKTGTLTENRMTVVAARLGGKDAPLSRPPPPRDALDAGLATHLELNCALNSKAFLVEPKAKEAAAEEPADGKKKKKVKAPAASGGAAGVAAAAATLNTSADGVGFVGNRTECALLMLLRGWGTPYKALRDTHAPRVVREYDFSSERKMASVLVTHPDPASAAKGACLLYAKGAAEIVVRRCVAAYAPGGGPPTPLDDRDRDALIEEVTGMAATGLRTICLAQKDVPASSLLPGGAPPEKPFEDGLTLMGIVGIKDPVRGEVPAAVATCQDAGITVRMVTGDNIHTAQHIARECGIFTEGGLSMEGPDFRALPEAELIALLPRLQVLARSSPADKLVLVRTLKGMGEIVAVTGDGTNDAPALKESDVGLAMGIAGTEVSKEAADIVILDDNFSSIVKAVMWGRSVFANIRKFLQFQLTVNFVALVVAFTAAVTNGETPLNVLQLLWVNLIMDAMAALALATEAPTPALLKERPHGRTEALISRKMWKHILTQGLYQLFWLFLIIYGAPRQLPGRYGLPPPTASFSAVDAAGVKGLAPILDGGGTGPFFPPPPAPLPTPGTTMPASARCTVGPCINTCCTPAPGGGCSDNLAGVDGGIYLPGEVALCYLSGGLDAKGRPMGTVQHAKRNTASFCGGTGTTCARADAFKALDTAATKQFHHDTEAGRQKYNSIVFNSFIFMQLFNELNARKINDELNIFSRLFTSPVFFWVIGITVVCQIIIMLTPLGNFFKVVPQSWQEWLFAVAIGAGCMVWALLVKLMTR